MHGTAMAGIGLVLLLLAALWLLRDGLRLMAHLRAADRLVAAGMSEPDALRAAGCLFWRRPWYRRLLAPYPTLEVRA